MSPTSDQYEYIDFDSINCELICSICSKPFVVPVSTPCDHTFCQDCIQRWIEKKNKPCPTCRQQIKSIDMCIPVNRPLRNMLDRLPIKCLSCEQTIAQRDQFNDHIRKVCPKMNISCSAADIKCTWTGPREDLDKHLTTCQFEPVRSLLSPLISDNQRLNTEKQQLTEQVNQQNIQLNDLTNKLTTISDGHLATNPILEKMNHTQSDLIVDFSHQKLVDRDLPDLIDKLSNKSCLSLQLQGNAITSQGINILADSLLKNFSNLHDLWLSNNCISDGGVLILVRTFLSKNSTLKQLHLGSNCITDKGVAYLTDWLRSNSSLTDLWLYNNQITNSGARCLAHVLRARNRHLKHLDLQWNKSITDTGAYAFINMLADNTILERLNLRKCNLSTEVKMKLLKLGSENEELKLII